MNDDRNSIVQGPPKFRWPWARGSDLDIGASPRGPHGDSTVAKAARTPPAARRRLPRLADGPRMSAPSVQVRSLPVQVVVLVALVYHLLGPGAAFLTGGDIGARGLLTLADSLIPPIFGFDVSRWLIPGAAAWMWQPLLAVGGAALLRLTALNTAGRDPLGAIWIAVAAAIVDLATWLFVGLKLWGTAFTPEEGQALITLLKVEGGTLLALFFILAPRGKKRLGETDEHFNR